jgi:hypothetical protein
MMAFEISEQYGCYVHISEFLHSTITMAFLSHPKKFTVHAFLSFVIFPPLEWPTGNILHYAYPTDQPAKEPDIK